MDDYSNITNPSKSSVREALLALRATLTSQQRALAALRLGTQLASFLDEHASELPDTPFVAAYAPLPNELDLTPALAMLYGSGARVAFPCTHSPESMDFFLVPASAFDQTERPAFLAHPNRFFPPEACSDFEYVAPESLDVMLVPGVGFDLARNRMGYGAGCYDRYLVRVPQKCLRVGIAFDEQIAQAIPTNEFDQAMDCVLTPTRVI